jgi:hypothetical protein
MFSLSMTLVGLWHKQVLIKTYIQLLMWQKNLMSLQYYYNKIDQITYYNWCCHIGPFFIGKILGTIIANKLECK